MKELNLTLRQRQILNYLHNTDGYVTGSQLSKWLHVSSRTIRNDISSINEMLEGSHTTIISKHSYGYHLQSTNSENLRELTQTSTSFIFKTDRIRHIVLCLCEAEKPVNLYELADEMYISKTTLDSDIRSFKEEYIDPFSIQMTINRSFVQIEPNERKRRRLLLHLYSQGWDYNHRSNTYYKNELISEKLINRCIMAILYTMDRFNIRMEDVNLVHLILTIAISIHRMDEGHVLQDVRSPIYEKPIAVQFVDEVLAFLHDQWDQEFPKAERVEMYELVSCSLIPDIDYATSHDASSYVDQKSIRLTNQYLNAIKEKFHFDFFDNEDFYQTLLYYFYYLSLPSHNLNYDNVIRNTSQQKLSFEMEVAYTVQPFAKETYGRYLDSLELLYLSIMISGAFVHLKHKKMRTVILSHLNMPAAWNIRMQVEHQFPDHIHVTNLVPVYMKDSFDFSSTDLVLTTVRKQIVSDQNISVIHINPYLDEKDIHAIDQLIKQKQYEFLYQKDFPSLLHYFDEADWEEKANDTDFNDLLKRVLTSLKQKDIIDDAFVSDVLCREQITGFANRPVYTLVYSSVPAKQTHISITTLNHRIKCNDQKIRMLIVLALSKEDTGLLYKFQNELYYTDWDPNASRFFKTKIEFMSFFQSVLK